MTRKQISGLHRFPPRHSQPLRQRLQSPPYRIKHWVPPGISCNARRHEGVRRLVAKRHRIVCFEPPPVFDDLRFPILKEFKRRDAVGLLVIHAGRRRHQVPEVVAVRECPRQDVIHFKAATGKGRVRPHASEVGLF